MTTTASDNFRVLSAMICKAAREAAHRFARFARLLARALRRSRYRDTLAGALVAQQALAAARYGGQLDTRPPTDLDEGAARLTAAIRSVGITTDEAFAEAADRTRWLTATTPMSVGTITIGADGIPREADGTEVDGFIISNPHDDPELISFQLTPGSVFLPSGVEITDDQARAIAHDPDADVIRLDDDDLPPGMPDDLIYHTGGVIPGAPRVSWPTRATSDPIGDAIADACRIEDVITPDELTDFVRGYEDPDAPKLSQIPWSSPCSDPVGDVLAYIDRARYDYPLLPPVVTRADVPADMHLVHAHPSQRDADHPVNVVRLTGGQVLCETCGRPTRRVDT